jgi:hypothetical protein
VDSHFKRHFPSPPKTPITEIGRSRQATAVHESPNQVDLPGRNWANQGVGRDTTGRQGQLRSGAGFRAGDGNVASAAGLLHAKRRPEDQAGRAAPLARSAPRPWTGRLCSPTRVQRPEGPSHNVPLYVVWAPMWRARTRCDGFSVVLESGGASTVATYDPASTTLTLNGVTYVKQ